MAFNAGDVVGFLKLDKNGFSKGLDDAAKETVTFSERFAKNAATIGKSMVVAGTIVTGALTAMVLKTAAAGDEMHKLASKTGISTKVLSGYTLAAELGGANLTIFVNAMKKLSRGMLDSSRGLLASKRGFDELGISVTDNEGNLRNIESVMLDVADKFKDMENGAMKTALAQEMFGRSGVELIPMLNEGAEGLRKQKEEAIALGGVISNDLANASANLIDEQARLNFSFKGVTQTISSAIMPAITDMFTSVTKVVSGVTSWMKANPVLTSVLVKFTAVMGAAMLILGPMVLLMPKIALLITSTLVPAFVKLKVVVMAMNPILAGFAAAAAMATLATQGFLKASEKRLKKTIELGNQEGKIMHEVNGFMAQASEAQKKSINERITRLRKMGVANKDIFKGIHIGLSNNSKAFKEWRKDVNESTKGAGPGEDTKQKFLDINGIIAKSVLKIKEMTLDQFSFRRFQAQQTYDENVKLLKKEEADDEQLLTLKRAHNLELAQISKDKNAKIKADNEAALEIYKEQEQEYIDFDTQTREDASENDQLELERKMALNGIIKNMAIERQLLGANEQTQKKIRLDEWYENEKSALEQHQGDYGLYKQALSDLDKNYALKKDKIDTDYNEKRRMSLLDYAKFATQTMNTLATFFNQITDRKIAGLQAEYEKQRQYIEDNVADETEKERQLEALEKKLTSEKRKAAKAAFLANKASGVASAIVNTATAVTKALPNIFLAAVIGAMGAIQVGIIASQKMPAMEKGGLVTGPTQALIGEGSQNEVVYPLDRFEKVMGIDEDGENSRGGKTFNFNICALDTISMVDAVNNKVIPIIQEAFNTEALLVNPEAVR